jgi:hypothetical protein
MAEVVEEAVVVARGRQVAALVLPARRPGRKVVALVLPARRLHHPTPRGLRRRGSRWCKSRERT